MSTTNSTDRHRQSNTGQTGRAEQASLLVCLSVCPSCLSLFLAVSVCLLHCRIQQKDGSLLGREKQRNAPVGVLEFPLGRTIWQKEWGAGRESEKSEGSSNTAGSVALEYNKGFILACMTIKLN